MKELKKALADARAKYHALNGAAQEQEKALRAAHAEVKKHQKALSDKISDGAKPCPGCGEAPIGIHHSDDTFEVGCQTCKPFEHTDGTRRSYRARGGLMARHTVEAWNEGPDYWVKTKPGR